MWIVGPPSGLWKKEIEKNALAPLVRCWILFLKQEKKLHSLPVGHLTLHTYSCSGTVFENQWKKSHSTFNLHLHLCVQLRYTNTFSIYRMFNHNVYNLLLFCKEIET